MSIKTEFGWDDEKSKNVSAEMAMISQKMLLVKDYDYGGIVNDIKQLDYSEDDKLAMALSIGMFIGKLANERKLL
jgi:hypothetical protein